MKLLPALALAAAFTFTPPVRAADGVTYEATAGPGKGKHIVLLAGDEEYRSEEALPQLAKILSQRHGFKCTVLFSINAPGWSAKEIADFKKANPDKPERLATDPDPADGTIDPNTGDNEPGLEALDTADLCITSLRYRHWPDAQMKHFADYLAAGKPFIGLRTSTHAFNGVSGTYKWFNDFGKNVLGERWVSHWGSHKKEATKGIIEEPAKSDPLLRGVADMEAVDTVQQTGRAVDQLADDVRVAGVTLRFGRDMHHDVMQRDGRVSPPPHVAHCIQRKFGDRRVREVPGVPEAVGR